MSNHKEQPTLSIPQEKTVANWDLKIKDILSKKIIDSLPLFNKLAICVLTVYVCTALGFAAFTPYNYSRRQSNFIHSLSTILLQPIMEVSGDGLISHFYDWNNIPREAIDVYNIKPIKVSSSYPRMGTYDQLSFGSIVSHLGGTRDAAIIKPKTYTQKWSLVYCTLEVEKNACQKGNVLVNGAVKILVDGPGQLWGMDEYGDILELKLISYLDRSDRKDLLLV